MSLKVLRYNPYRYEGYSKINLRLVGKNKRVVIASKRTLSSNKELLFLLYAYPHTFSPRSVGVNTDKTWTLSSPLSPAVSEVDFGITLVCRLKDSDVCVLRSPDKSYKIRLILFLIEHFGRLPSPSSEFCRSWLHIVCRDKPWGFSP